MKTNFLSLEFFSKHFNVPQNQLAWGIIEEKKEFKPAIIIKKTNLAIDIEQGLIKSILDVFQDRRNFHEAKLSPIKGYDNVFELISNSPILNNEPVAIEISEQSVKTLYQYRWYDKSLNGKLIF